MIYYFFGVVLAIASLIFNSIPALIGGLIIISIGMIGER